MSENRIDVVMSIYNAERYLPEAIQSILHQTFPQFRLICVDDGSTDGSAEILDRFAAADSRVEIIRQTNQGVVGAANAGVAACTAPLIARMDSDDIAMPERFAKQVEFLDSHPDVVAVGAGILEIDSSGGALAVVQYPTSHEQIDSANLVLKSAIANPVSMLRRTAIESVGGYRPEFAWVEDLDLWLRLAEVGKLANLPEVLLCYRQHAASGTWNGGVTRDERLVSLLEETYARRGLARPEQLIRKCRRPRSPAGPLKWAKKASRQGQWEIACKHLRSQWGTNPLSARTWSTTIEVAARSAVACAFGKRAQFPPIPSYRDAA
ncbi:Putative glycosyltransferase EpsE [Rosistilla ulvae]|uniref:Glycosyltransferase EpsE n=1 Tax=Rosistilla ulvae TaxID=1930277 RepID=A0A517LYQ0_9BACT|nr:glycosyltransferase [Rosistilla ulvae]QDS87748.1 Putative glycosyltransferase EpsE [Rosistilla ulvae]